MTLGEKIRQARLEAGLSQRQLCDGIVTRNMLSQIENGAAKPSMDTLSCFAARLGRTVSYFLEETAVCSPNQEVMARARAAVLEGRGAEALPILESYKAPDGTFDAEYQLLRRLAVLSAAEEALQKGQPLFAAQLLEETRIQGGYCAAALERQRLLLLARAQPRLRGQLCEKLPDLDEELLLRAFAALEQGEPHRCAALLDAARNQDTPQWNFLRGELYFQAGQFALAAPCYHRAESSFPETCSPRLEQCYRELEDFKKAYFYACKQRRATR